MKEKEKLEEKENIKTQLLNDQIDSELKINLEK